MLAWDQYNRTENARGIEKRPSLGSSQGRLVALRDWTSISAYDASASEAAFTFMVASLADLVAVTISLMLWLMA